MTKEEFENKIKKPAIKFQIGGFRPDDSLTASWLGNITVGLPDEQWPESNGQPMIPVLQLNLKVLQHIPDNLKDIELIVLFVDAEELPDAVANLDSSEQGWILRAYEDINSLEAIVKPDVVFPIKPFQLKQQVIQQDYPCWEDCPLEIPEEFEEDYQELFRNHDGIKMGGWPTLIQSEIFWAPFNKHPANPEYVLQIDSIEKANWMWGDNGVAYIGRGRNPTSKSAWTFSWQCY